MAEAEEVVGWSGRAREDDGWAEEQMEEMSG